MQTAIHPQWYKDANVTCACGNTFTIGASKEGYEVEVCAACHPYFTGQMKFLDQAGRVDAFREKQRQAKDKVLSKAQRRKLKREQKIEEELSLPETLTEIKKTIKKAN